MKFTTPALITALGITAAAVTTGTAHAEPDRTAVHYEIGRQADSALVTTSDGKLKVVADQLILTDRADRPVAAVPLTFAVDDIAYPITAHIDGSTATLTPDRGNGRPTQARRDVVSVRQAAESFTPRDSQALGAFGQRVAIAAGVSAVLGAVIGGGIGCLVGGAVGAAISSPVIVLLAPFVGATVAGCVLGAATLGAVGSMAGLILAGGPITLFSAIQYFSTVLAPCPPELPYCKDPAQPAPAK
ncbi:MULTISPECIES: hypothetical protein [Nocardia]|jgi:hypothetical protein|uniref:hypothetical protein n=1 Tax=Nocardia TaxID=1817 RepID=UPI0007EB108B|nr:MULTISPECIES: hypothetical protein [Nocardia]OBF69340.1 hypothetical protein A9X06_32535 [Mycobacterium sp. 852002-51759_SCH5129042]MBF6274148.1 hypothetical protein [Nocardia nova]OBA46465.1 hypothetical protein A5789_04940 [Nocardia sp. 852002-51101_SCH5132738]OBB39046.1 hypothetical protein A5748_35160 [Nocardia sp. 852002-51244_SCH5132740]PPJ10734.1 hypothetical protein C5E51_10755 [Nocardia nova]